MGERVGHGSLSVQKTTELQDQPVTQAARK